MTSAGNAYLETRATGWRLVCRASDLDDQGLPLFHPLILPAFIIGLAGFVTCIVAWAINLISLIGALVVVPLAMVYCMGVKSFHKSCRKMCIRDRNKDAERAISTGIANPGLEQDGPDGPAVSRRAMASPKRIGKRQSLLQAQQEKLKKVNQELDHSNGVTNGDVPRIQENNLQPNGDINSNGRTSAAESKSDRSPLPDVESPFNIDLISNTSRRNETGLSMLSETSYGDHLAPEDSGRGGAASEDSGRGEAAPEDRDRSGAEKAKPLSDDENKQENDTSDLTDSVPSSADTRTAEPAENNEASLKEVDNQEDKQSNASRDIHVPISDNEEVPPPGYYEATNQAFDKESEKL